MNNSAQSKVPQYSGTSYSGQISYVPKLDTVVTDKRVGHSTTPLGTTAQSTEQSCKYQIRTASQLLEKPVTWAVKGLFPQKGLGLIYGASGAGKSFLALDLVAAIAEGRPWFNHRTTKSPVIYLCLEGAAGFSRRVRAWEASNGRPLTERVGFVTKSFDLLNQECVRELVRAIGQFAKTASAELGPPVVVIDTLNRAMPGADENSSGAMGGVLDACSLISDASGGLTVLVHHVGKDPERGARGHSSLTAAVDASLMVVRSAKGRFWEAKKVKDGLDGIQGNFELETLTLGVDADGDEISSCIVRGSSSDTTTARAPQTQQLSSSVKTALLSLQAAMPPIEAAAFATGICAVSLADWREELYKNTTAKSASGKRNALSRALRELKGLDFVSADGDSLNVSAKALELLSSMTKKH